MTDQHPQLEVAQQYAAGALDATASAAFEDHMIGCEICQAEVRLTVGVRRLARRAPASSRNRWVVGATALLAAVIALFMIIPGNVDPRLVDLGRVTEPPAYVGMSVRSLPQHRDSLFASAMNAYVARRYDEAASGLRAALAAGVDTVPATFFMASSELMAGRPSEAAANFSRVIAAGELAAGYLPEAHLFRARALLQLGRGKEALSDLEAVSRDDAHGAAAAALAASVAQVIGR
jgi:tetratricopeptide (TPR) repeat protein